MICPITNLSQTYFAFYSLYLKRIVSDAFAGQFLLLHLLLFTYHFHFFPQTGYLLLYTGLFKNENVCMIII